MTPYEIPLSPNPQQFLITLGQVAYGLTVRWCTPMSCWIMDIATEAGALILGAVPLQPGVDLLGQHQHLGIGGSIYVQSDADLNATPQYNDLGISGHVYFVVP